MKKITSKEVEAHAEAKEKVNGGKKPGSDCSAVQARDTSWWYWHLPSAGDLLRDVGLAVEGRMCLDIFSGCSV